MLVHKDPWASRWNWKPPRTMSSTDLRNWAESRVTFVGAIYRDPAFLAILNTGEPFHLFSKQGIPSTAHQMTVILKADENGVWRVVYRTVRERPCL